MIVNTAKIQTISLLLSPLVPADDRLSFIEVDSEFNNSPTVCMDHIDFKYSTEIIGSIYPAPLTFLIC